MKRKFELVELYYDKDYYICNAESTLQDCFIGDETALKARYEEDKQIWIEDGDDSPYENYEEWKNEMLYAWFDYELAELSSYEDIHEFYYFTASGELKTAMEMYMLWQNIRNIHNYHDTFGAMMNNPQNDRNGEQFYGFDIEPKKH